MMRCGCAERTTASMDARFAASPLLARGGFAISRLLYGTSGVDALLHEAVACYPQSKESNTVAADTEEFRGGNPARRFLSCGAGPAQDQFYHHPAILEFLRELTQLDVTTTGARGTYTYYVRPGDYLSVHRDVRTCDLAVVTCLMDTAGPGQPGGMMDFYPQRTEEPLSAIRATPRVGLQSLRLQPGETVIMFGGIVPHAITPVSHGQHRIVSVLCYEAK